MCLLSVQTQWVGEVYRVITNRGNSALVVRMAGPSSLKLVQDCSLFSILMLTRDLAERISKFPPIGMNRLPESAHPMPLCTNKIPKARQSSDAHND